MRWVSVLVLLCACGPSSESVQTMDRPATTVPALTSAQRSVSACLRAIEEGWLAVEAREIIYDPGPMTLACAKAVDSIADDATRSQLQARNDIDLLSEWLVALDDTRSYMDAAEVRSDVFGWTDEIREAFDLPAAD